MPPTTPDHDWTMTRDELVRRTGTKALTDARLAELRARIHPVMLTEKGKLYGIRTKSVNPRKEAFGFAKVPHFDPGSLKEIGRIETYHTCGYAGFFKPTEAECLAQIPAAYLDRIVAYGGWDMDELKIVAEGQGHRAVTRLYVTKGK